ncbi:hypothetical protein SAMN05216387_10418 [Nitrosovibrio tenuis]|uniref:Uncharacterized protein n=1 Tax=Nitrosovibrio tenuis TaxID=1233 RepID=A0A1H7LCA1_9PROT|nr:hypothetical protein SAMN05216387_10418 [Nitrosovibrio tenuis]
MESYKRRQSIARGSRKAGTGQLNVPRPQVWAIPSRCGMVRELSLPRVRLVHRVAVASAWGLFEVPLRR